MSTVILSAASPSQPSLQHAWDQLTAELARAGEAHVRTFDLATTPLAYCQGEFDCWVKTPGVCRAHDAEAAIVQAIHDADRLVTLDAMTFGAQDCIVLVSRGHKQDEDALRHVIGRGAGYVGMIGSRRRTAKIGRAHV